MNTGWLLRDAMYHGEFYCEPCEEHIEVDAEDVSEARDIALTHHEEKHE